jgi:hypothetical protein
VSSLLASSVSRKTIFSDDRLYRYTLWRKWIGNDYHRMEQYLMIIGLNPSTADETKDDPTIRRCVDFAKRLGFGALCMTNLFAWRDTDPDAMMKVASPIGRDNDDILSSHAIEAGMVIAAWGTKGKHRNRDKEVKRILRQASVKIMCLRKTKAGYPEHPLYLPATLQPLDL